MSKDCHTALRKYFCGQYYLAPAAQNIKNVFISNLGSQYAAGFFYNLKGINSTGFQQHTFYLPSYPHKSICIDYQEKCKSFIVAANSSALVPNCTSIKKGIAQFPERNQTIVSLIVPGLPGVIKFSSFPNLMADTIAQSAMPFRTKCPEGFVVPEDPLSRGISWVPGTGCALACRYPTWTADEWTSFQGITTGMPAIGLASIVLLLATWLGDKKRRKQYLIICFASCSAIASLFFVIMAGIPIDTRFCRNNAAGLDGMDGPTVCGTQTFILMYFGLACVLGWGAQCIDLFLKIVMQIKTDHVMYMASYFSVIFLLPLIPVIITAVNKWQGYSRTLTWCFLHPDVPSNVDIALFYLPIMIVTAIGFVAISAVIGKIYVTTSKAHGASTAAQISPEVESDVSGQSKSVLRQSFNIGKAKLIKQVEMIKYALILLLDENLRTISVLTQFQLNISVVLTQYLISSVLA